MTESTKFSLKNTFKEAIRSRVFLVLFIIIILEAITFVTLVLLFGKIGVPQVPIRYDGFSFTELFRENGSYLINFIVFSIAIATINILVSLKIYHAKGRLVAIGILWLTIIIFLMLTIILLTLLKTGSVL